MNAKKIILIISAIFYIIIMGFSFSARTIHTASLPRVKVINLDFEKFAIAETEATVNINNDSIAQADVGVSINNDSNTQAEAVAGIDNASNDNEAELNNTKYDFQLGIPIDICDNKKVYILSTKIINGEERNIVKEITNLELGRSNESFCEVLQGITSMDQVIIEGQDILQDGCEVYVEE